jgi:ceramide glucosyltransferase
VSLVNFVVAATIVSLALYATQFAVFASALTWRRWRHAPRRQTDRGRGTYAPRVSVLKPLAGVDDDLDENLESFSRIDYPSFEILIGVASASDPAYAAARRFISDHPRIDARLILTDPNAAMNPKVAQLIELDRMATGEISVISDSNVRVVPDYLWSLVSELADEHVGIVTNLFSGNGERTLGAALENLQLCAATTPGLAAIDVVSRAPFTVGKSMAVRRRDLERLGGFQAVGHVLAEDFVLGRRFLDAGLGLRTSFHVVENRNVDCTVARTFDRHTRWAKMRRSLKPKTFAAEPVMTPITVATVALLVAPCHTTAALLVGIATFQTACAMLSVRLLRGRSLAWWYAPLEVVRSYLVLLAWLSAWASNRIAWRGHPFLLRKGSVIVPVTGSGEGGPGEPSAGHGRLAA